MGNGSSDISSDRRFTFLVIISAVIGGVLFAVILDVLNLQLDRTMKVGIARSVIVVMPVGIVLALIGPRMQNRRLGAALTAIGLGAFGLAALGTLVVSMSK